MHQSVRQATPWQHVIIPYSSDSQIYRGRVAPTACFFWIGQVLPFWISLELLQDPR